MALANKVVVLISIILGLTKVGLCGDSSLPTIHNLGDSASAGWTTVPDNYSTTQGFYIGDTLLSELSNKGDRVLEEVNQAKPGIKVDSISAPKEQIPDMIFEISTGQSNRFPSEILLIVFFLIMYYLGAHVLNLAIPAIIFFAMMYFLGIN